MAVEAAISSQDELSSPKSPSSLEDSIVLAPANGSGQVSYPDLSGAANSAKANANGSASSLTGPKAAKTEDPEKPTRKRRARATTTEGKDGEDPSKPAKAPRKARAPRKPKAEPDAASQPPTAVNPATTTAATSAAAAAPSPSPAQMSRPSSRQQKITDLVNPDPPGYHSAYPSTGSPSTTALVYQNGGSNDPQRGQTYKPESTTHSLMNSNPTYSPRSGQRYDPIRSSTADNPRAYPSSSTPLQNSPTKAPYRASASPSISSLIDPPSTVSNPSFSYTPPAKPSPVASAAVLNAAPNTSPSLLNLQQSPQQCAQNAQNQSNAAADLTKKLEVSDAMDIDSDKASAGKQASRKTSVSNTNPPSKAPSPKPTKKEKDKVGTTPPLPPLPGSSAIASTLFGPGQSKGDTVTGPTVVLHVPLNGETNKYVNFARLAEEKYSFGVLHPRLAAQRDRLARVAAAGAALENAQKGSGDEMSLDISDGENDLSNVEMGDAGDIKTAGEAEGGKKPRKKRRMKEDMYDKEDPFVDDSEMAWEEQAAASKDGFFVYSGPLIPEGETARVERADGSIIKPPSGRGRGSRRGGGPGSRGGTSRTGAGSRGGRTTTGARRPRAKKVADPAEAAKKADASDTSPAASKTIKSEPVHASPLGQNVQVQVPSGLQTNGAAAADARPNGTEPTAAAA